MKREREMRKENLERSFAPCPEASNAVLERQTKSKYQTCPDPILTVLLLLPRYPSGSFLLSGEEGLSFFLLGSPQYRGCGWGSAKVGGCAHVVCVVFGS